MFQAGGVIAFLLFAFWVWALFDCISTDAALCRNLPKVVWLIIVVLLFGLGAAAWLLLGRPERAGWTPGASDSSRRPRPLGNKDHLRNNTMPEITDRRSAELDRELEQWERTQAEQREQELGNDEP